MIRQLQHRFVLIASVAVMVVLLTVVGVINGAMRGVVQLQIGRAMDEFSAFYQDNDIDSTQHRRFFTSSTLTNYFFIAILDAQGNLLRLNLDHDILLDEDEAEDFVAQALDSGSDRGQLKLEGIEYAWRRIENVRDTDSDLIVFLDCTPARNMVRSLHRTSLMISCVSFCAFVIAFIVLSGKAIEPFARNIEGQKRFITNASHELKTPVAIISANTELLEAIYGENEWTHNTLSQTQRLTGLINELVTLSKVSEVSTPELQIVDLSAITTVCAGDIQPVITNQGKTLDTEIAPEIYISGDDNLLHMLDNILLENASKYCDEQGRIQVSLQKLRDGRVQLSVSNDYAAGKGVDYNRFFERFYQEEQSHQHAGFGIGLSIAQEIVRNLRGSIHAEYKDNRIRFVCLFPRAREGAPKARQATHTND